jgi:hypothetical protein
MIGPFAAQRCFRQVVEFLVDQRKQLLERRRVAIPSSRKQNRDG